MNAMVTGGAGFIGSHLTELLIREGCRVTVLDNFSTGRRQNLRSLEKTKNLTIHKADISRFDAIKTLFKGVDYVFHLAALADIVPSIERPLDYYKSNVSGTVSVLEASRRAGVKRFLYAASSSCYGIAREYPTKETAEIRPEYPYALTKNLGEQCAMHWSKVYGLPTVSLRLFNVYGPRARTSGTYGAVFGVFLAQMLHKKPFTVVGDGTQTRDFVFVTDVAKAFWKAANADISGEIFNIGSGSPVSVNRITEILGGDVVFVPKRPGEPDVTHADITKARKVLGWEPVIKIEEGIQTLKKNINDFKNAPVWTPDSIKEATKTWFAYLKG
ncbi:MAG TPA: SDR family oxidoreductase [Candidatus Omnitrophota bacterium]|nr:SDR family oxidoreductase [Candidatus Omnitrophota bacterium]